MTQNWPPRCFDSYLQIVQPSYLISSPPPRHYTSHSSHTSFQRCAGVEYVRLSSMVLMARCRLTSTSTHYLRSVSHRCLLVTYINDLQHPSRLALCECANRMWKMWVPWWFHMVQAMAYCRSLFETVHEIMVLTWRYQQYLTFDKDKDMIGYVATAHIYCMKQCKCSQVPFAPALLLVRHRLCHLFSYRRNCKMTLSLASLFKMYYTIIFEYKCPLNTLKVDIIFESAHLSTILQTNMFIWKKPFYSSRIAGFTHHGVDQCKLHNIRHHTQTHQPRATQLLLKV